jgi:hypothetical protein
MYQVNLEAVDSSFCFQNVETVSLDLLCDSAIPDKHKSNRLVCGSNSGVKRSSIGRSAPA